MDVIEFLFDISPNLLKVYGAVAEWFSTTKISLFAPLGYLRETGLLSDWLVERLPFLNLIPDHGWTSYTFIEFLLGPGLIGFLSLLAIKWIWEWFH